MVICKERRKKRRNFYSQYKFCSHQSQATQRKVRCEFRWKLRVPDPITSFAARVKPEFRLTPAQQAQHPDHPAAPLAHPVCEENPLGQGYSEAWYRDALKLKRIAAPQIEDPNDPIAEFGKHYTPQGLGVRPKSHPARRKLGGTIDAAFIENNKPLPDDFDFGVWNAAPPDQQCDFLHGDEVIELTNLCAPAAAGAKCDAVGNTVLTLTLPGALPFVLVRFEDGMIGELPAELDTLVIDTEAQHVACVWRATLPMEPPVQRLEARMNLKPGAGNG